MGRVSDFQPSTTSVLPAMSVLTCHHAGSMLGSWALSPKLCCDACPYRVTQGRDSCNSLKITLPFFFPPDSKMIDAGPLFYHCIG